jgi:hypothetical protein
MGFRFQKRISIMPGLRLNLSKHGPSLSIGRRGAWFTIGSRGTRATIGIPGTGISWSESSKSTHVHQLAPTQKPTPHQTVITVPLDKADRNCKAPDAQGCETELRPPAAPKSKSFAWFCVAGFLVSFLLIALVLRA